MVYLAEVFLGALRGGTTSVDDGRNLFGCALNTY